MTDHRRIRSAAAGALILAAGLAHAQGTASMLSDICPGTAGSQASGFSDCGTALYFRARILPDLVSFRTFRTDGTPGGTVSISYPGLTFAGVPILYGGRHYFGGTEGTMGSELYSGDGTTATLVLDINPGAASSTPQDLVVVRGLLFFRAFVGTRWGLWRSDGTAAGTFPLADLGTMNVPMVAAPSRDFLYFVPEDATVGRELWRTDGTLAGTVLVADINPGVASSNPQRLTDDGLILFFGATTPSTGLEPWVTDGTNTTLLRDISPGPGSSLLFGTPSERMVAAGGNLVFAAFDLANGRELWKSDGTPGGTVLLKDLVPGEDPSQPSELTKFGDLVLISAMDLGLAIRLWKTDGTTAGTVQLTLASQGSGPFAVPGAGRAVFLGTANATGNELYRTDGSPAGTVLHQDLVPGTGSSTPVGVAQSGSKLYLMATTPAAGTEVWVLDTMAASVPFGNGCPGTGGRVPVISGAGVPTIGNAAFGVRVANALPNAAAFVAMGFLPLAVPLGGGCGLYFLPPPFPLLFGATTNGSGSATVTLGIPNDPSIAAFPLYFQAAVADPLGAFSGLSFTSGLRVVPNVN